MAYGLFSLFIKTLLVLIGSKPSSLIKEEVLTSDGISETEEVLLFFESKNSLVAAKVITDVAKTTDPKLEKLSIML